MFLENLELLMSERGLNKNSLSLQSGIPYTTIDGFFKRSYENTKLSTLRQLATFFDVDLDFLVYGKSTAHEHITTNEKKLLSNYKQLSHIGQMKVLDFCDDLISSGKYSAVGREYGYSIAAYGADETDENFQPPEEAITT